MIRLVLFSLIENATLFKQRYSEISNFFVWNFFLNVFRCFWCVDIKNNFLKIKNILFWWTSKWKTLGTATANTHVCFCVSKTLLEKFQIFYFFSLLQINIFFYVFRSFWCVDVKNNFLKIKNIYYFNVFQSEKHFEVWTTTANTFVCFCVLKTLLKKIKIFIFFSLI